MNLTKIIKNNKGFILGIILILFVRSFLYSHNIIPSGSMMPVTMPGDFMTTNKLAYQLKLPFTDKVLYRWNEPEIGEVITFNENNSGMYMIKRVIAKEGDIVTYKNREIYVNNKKITRNRLDNHNLNQDKMVKSSNSISNYEFFEETVNGKSYIVSYGIFDSTVKKDYIEYLNSSFTYTVPKDSLFVLGDNRNQSVDSRYFAAIHKDQVVGRAHLVLFNYKFNNTRSFYSIN